MVVKEVIGHYDVKVDDKQLDGLQKTLASVGKGLLKFGKIAAAGIATAGLAIAGSMWTASEAMQEANRNAGMFGTTIQQWEGLAQAARSVGMDVEDMAGAMETVTETAIEAGEAGNEFGTIYKDLGVELKDANGNARDNVDIMWDLQKAAKGATDENQNMQKIQKILGGDVVKLTAFLKGNTEELRKNAEFGKRVGFSQAQIDANKKFQAAFATIGKIVQKVGAVFIQVLQPAITWVTDSFKDLFLSVDDGLDTNTLEQWGLKVKIFLMDAELAFWNFVDTVQSALDKWQNFVHDNADEVEAALVGLSVAISVILIPIVYSLVTAFTAWAVSVIAATWPILAIIAVITLVVGALYYLFNNWDKIWNAILAFNEAFWDTIFDSISSAIDWIGEKFTAFGEMISGVFSGIWNGIKDGVTSALDFVMSKINALLNNPLVKKAKSLFGFGGEDAGGPSGNNAGTPKEATAATFGGGKTDVDQSDNSTNTTTVNNNITVSGTGDPATVAGNVGGAVGTATENANAKAALRRRRL